MDIFTSWTLVLSVTQLCMKSLEAISLHTACKDLFDLYLCLLGWIRCLAMHSAKTTNWSKQTRSKAYTWPVHSWSGAMCRCLTSAGTLRGQNAHHCSICTPCHHATLLQKYYSLVLLLGIHDWPIQFLLCLHHRPWFHVRQTWSCSERMCLFGLSVKRRKRNTEILCVTNLHSQNTNKFNVVETLRALCQDWLHLKIGKKSSKYSEAW